MVIPYHIRYVLVTQSSLFYITGWWGSVLDVFRAVHTNLGTPIEHLIYQLYYNPYNKELQYQVWCHSDQALQSLSVITIWYSKLYFKLCDRYNFLDSWDRFNKRGRHLNSSVAN